MSNWKNTMPSNGDILQNKWIVINETPPKNVFSHIIHKRRFHGACQMSMHDYDVK